MVNKPGRRKPTSRRTTYLLIGVVVAVLVVAAGWYYYNSGASTLPGTGKYARIYTSLGSFEVELYPSSAPQTVANFVHLAQTGFYDNLVWHRIAAAPDVSVIQTGDPSTRNAAGDRSTWGGGSSTPTVPLEVSNASLHNDRSYLGLARGNDNNSGSCQFYVNTGDNRNLDGRYAVFGRVISGMSVVDALAALQVYGSTDPYPEQPVNPSEAMMINVTIIASP